MKKVTLEKVQARLSEYVKTVAKEPVLILRDGEPVAILVGIDSNERRTPLRLRDVLKRAWKDYEEQGGIPHKQFWNDLATEADQAQQV
jgi:prevent-host-death family protein